MNEKRLVKTSKYLSRHLRHDPGRLGLTLEPGGWVPIEALLRACRSQSFALTIEDLRQVVERNDKQRFSFDETGTRIRANQGHSVEVDLELEPAKPPAVLFHGTGLQHLDAIMRAGLRRAGRHHVHLSTDTATATRVGARHGRPVVLEVAAARMREDGLRRSSAESAMSLLGRVSRRLTCQAERHRMRPKLPPRCHPRQYGFDLLARVARPHESLDELRVQPEVEQKVDLKPQNNSSSSRTCFDRTLQWVK